MIIQIYEIQSPHEAALMVECEVDHIGGVLLSAEDWKIPPLSESLEIIRQAGCKSSIIPLFANPEAVFRAIGHYAPDIIHFCESLSFGNRLDERAIEAALSLQHGVRPSSTQGVRDYTLCA